MTDKTDIDAVATVAAAYFSANPVAKTEIVEIISLIRDALHGSTHASPTLLGDDAQQPVTIRKQEKLPSPRVAPAVAIEQSIQPDHLVCLICGKSQKTIRRHLRSVHNIEGEQYLKMFGLPADYPFAAPNYAASRSEIARATTDVRLGRVQETVPKHDPESSQGAAHSSSDVPEVDPLDEFAGLVYNLDEMFKDVEPAEEAASGKRSSRRSGKSKKPKKGSLDDYLDNMTPEQAQELLDLANAMTPQQTE